MVFFLSFSAPRLYHSLATAVDDAGFEIRDMINWVYSQSFPKGMGVQKQIARLSISDEKKKELQEYYSTYKTPMLKTCFEPICVAMKPREGTFLNNELRYKTGLINYGIKVGQDRVPANIITTGMIDTFYDKNFIVKKPSKKEKGSHNSHPTVKPLQLIEHLILLFSKKHALVVDPFLGSGTTGVACRNTQRKHIGIELNAVYYNIAKKRLSN